MTKFNLRRRHAVLLALAVATALYTSLAVSPAAAAGHDASHESAVCQFSSVDTLSAFGSAARGDDAREPALNQVADEVPAGAKGKGGKGFKATIPVYFHVVSPDGVIGNVSDRAIREQMNAMNLGFGGFEGGYATGFRFELAGITRSVNAEWFNAGPTTSGERGMKTALHRGGDNALNWYSTTAGAYLGWAYFPNVLDNATRYLDGIVVDWESMPGTSARYAGKYDLGKTGVHEAGHWLNLHHVFNGGCNNFGDYVEDTPPQLLATNGCPIGQDSCRQPGIDSIHNYMDYSWDSCYYEFTKGQTLRMQDAYLHWRA